MNSDGAFWNTRGHSSHPFSLESKERILAYDVDLNRVIALIPKDGFNGDLQPLFSCLILDAATEFLRLAVKSWLVEL